MSRKQTIARSWNDLVRNLRHMEDKTLELIRHPQATPEDIALVANQYRDAYERMLTQEPRVVQEVANAYPLSKLKRTSP